MSKELNRREPVCEHTSGELKTAQDLPFWKGCLWWIWGFTIGLIIGA